jgi:hypothetical protein
MNAGTRIVHDVHLMELVGESLRRRQKAKINEELEIQE